MGDDISGVQVRAVSEGLDLPHLKQVSKIKHRILEKYLPPWAVILGYGGAPLCYVDCFAGPGRYRDRERKEVEGSPVIAVRAAKQFCAAKPHHSMSIVLMEKDADQLVLLNRHLMDLQPYGSRLRVTVYPDDSLQVVPRLLAELPRTTPAFFLIDPFGNPLPVPVINAILRRPKTEALINLMHYSINMHLNNSREQDRMDQLFSHSDWRHQPFMQLRGAERERSFLDYFRSQLHAKYVFPFKIMMDKVEDRVRGNRTKYYLLHASNNRRAVLLMKEVMYPLGDEEGTFDYSGAAQGVLISRTPQIGELQRILLQQFMDRTVAFDDIREETWHLPFIEKHYRKAIQDLRAQNGVRDYGHVEVTPVDSKTPRGLRGRDLVSFAPF